MRCLLVAVLAIACSSPPVIVVPDGGTTAPDTGEPPDAGSSTDGGSEPEGLVFRLKFISDVPESIYVQVSGYDGTPEWIRVLRGDVRLAMFSPCEICSCDQCHGCGVCGAALPVVAEIQTNGAHELAWEARIYPRETCAGGNTCWRRIPLAAATYTAQFCWGTTANGTGPGHFVSNVTCADVPFTYPVAGGIVEHVVDHGG